MFASVACMNNKEADRLNAVVAELQTELNRIDRLSAASLQVGSAEDLQVLRLLLANGAQRVGEIAARRCSSVATVSARLDRLERRGLVVRERLPDDRRAVVAKLTETGLATAKNSSRDRTTTLRRLSPGFPTDELQALVEVLAASLEPSTS